MKKNKKICFKVFIFTVVLMLTVALSFVLLSKQQVFAAEADNTGTVTDGGNDGFGFFYNTGNNEGNLSSNLKILIFLTVISLAPSILIMMTSFTRITVVLHFLRTAIGTQTTPPNQILVGLALFLTLFIMTPTFTRVNEEAIKPLDAGEINQEEALDTALNHMRRFMYSQIQSKDLALFCDIADVDEAILVSIDEAEGEEARAAALNQLQISIIIPSFIIGELRQAFIMGFLVYVPFIVIDMVVASVLMSMGMMMLPPATISMPFKILLFIMADGWDLVIGSLVRTFY